MTNTQRALDILSDTGDDENQTNSSDQEAQWVSVEDILYQPIIITRANVMDKYDKTYDRNRTFAYVNFYFAEDVEQTPWVFRTGWQKIRKQINALNAAKAAGDNPYPVECGVAEILINNPLQGDDGSVRFPLQLLPFEQLDAEETAATSFSLKETVNESPATAAPAPQPAKATAPAASPARAGTIAATAGRRSATASAKTPPALRGRGN